MFDVPFIYGGPWTQAQDDARAAVVVIGKKLNDKLFNGRNSVGKTINLDGHDYRITGVIGEWDPQPLFFYPVNTGGFGDSFGGLLDDGLVLGSLLALRGRRLLGWAHRRWRGRLAFA